jgi:aminoglycoside phosphotransferase (APT) family kinase protein
MPKMHDDEFEIDASLVRRLVAGQFPEWADLPIEPVPSGGTDNALYRLGDEMVVRLPRHERTAGTLERELQWLPFLAPRLPLAAPEPLAAAQPAAGYPWVWAVYRWLEGETATAECIADPRVFATDLAGLVAAFWDIDPRGGPPPEAANAFRGVPLAARDEAVRRAIALRGDTIDGAAAAAAWDDALRAPEWEAEPVWIHGDLDARNLLVRDGRLTAVLDFGCTGVGDPACDVAVAWKAFTNETREVLRAALAVDEATWARGRGWTLSQALQTEPYYTLETNPELVLAGRRWLTEVLADRAEAEA